MNTKQHNLMVNEFLKRAKEKDKELYQEVCKRNPTLTPQRWQSVHQHEVPYSATENDALFGENEEE